ncbi:hypothetical protein PF003_g3876 [Phytophthora fragariae]|nr:hypothetical protein PF003_g3876 [Phytophthora fragariae]
MLMSTSSKAKTSQQRSVCSKVLEQYPDLEPYAEMLMPKKAPMVGPKCHNRIVGNNVEIGTFVYGAMRSTDKISSHVAIVFIQITRQTLHDLSEQSARRQIDRVYKGSYERMQLPADFE